MEWHRKFKLSEHFTLCLLFVRYYEPVHFYLFKEYLLDAIYCRVVSSSVIIDWWDLEEMIYIYVKYIYSFA